jgi:hypothetical protein
MPVDYYEFGRIVVDGESFTSDVIISADGIVNTRWWRVEGHRVCKDDVRDILDSSPEIVVFGTGYHGLVKVDREVENFLESKGIEVEKFVSREAVKRFNELVKEGKRVVLAVHLTC